MDAEAQLRQGVRLHFATASTPTAVRVRGHVDMKRPVWPRISPQDAATLNNKVAAFMPISVCIVTQ